MEFGFEPVDEKDMDEVGSRITPCELLRQIYKKTDDEEIRLLCRVTTRMAKHLTERISKHEGRGWGRKVWLVNPEFKKEK